MIHIDSREDDLKMQKEIKGRANYSIAVLGKAIKLNGSGKSLNIRSPAFLGPEETETTKKEHELAGATV